MKLVNFIEDLSQKSKDELIERIASDPHKSLKESQDSLTSSQQRLEALGEAYSVQQSTIQSLQSQLDAI